MRRVSEDGDGSACISIHINECRPVDAIAALPTNREGGIGFFNIDWLRVAVAGQPRSELIGRDQEPRIACFVGEKDQLTASDDATVVVGRASLNVTNLVGETKTPAVHLALARSTLDHFPPLPRASWCWPWICLPSCSATSSRSSITASTALSFTATSPPCRDPSSWYTSSVRCSAFRW